MRAQDSHPKHAVIGIHGKDPCVVASWMRCEGEAASVAHSIRSQIPTLTSIYSYPVLARSNVPGLV